MLVRRLFPFAALAVLIAACSGASGNDTSSGGDSGASGDDASSDGGASSSDGGPGSDAHTSDSSSSSGTDGTASHGTCTTSFNGTAITGSFGRLDGYLVSIVPPGGSHSCRGDSGHVHLQVKVSSVVYDIAVNTDTYLAEKDIGLPDGAWSEGWHAGVKLDYPTTLQLHSSDFPTTNANALAQSVENALGNANHVSIFATPYDTTGAHDVHRKGGGVDGAIFVNPLSNPAHVLAFRFNTDSF